MGGDSHVLLGGQKLLDQEGLQLVNKVTCIVLHKPMGICRHCTKDVFIQLFLCISVGKGDALQFPKFLLTNKMSIDLLWGVGWNCAFLELQQRKSVMNSGWNPTKASSCNTAFRCLGAKTSEVDYSYHVCVNLGCNPATLKVGLNLIEIRET